MPLPDFTAQLAAVKTAVDGMDTTPVREAVRELMVLQAKIGDALQNQPDLEVIVDAGAERFGFGRYKNSTAYGFFLEDAFPGQRRDWDTTPRDVFAAYKAAPALVAALMTAVGAVVGSAVRRA